MITSLKHVQNVGRFENAKHNPDLVFKSLGLVFSENGRGKTTLCAILRSLTTGAPAPILERHRLSAKKPPVVAIEVNGAVVAFNGSTWTSRGPEIFIFDDHFVEANIYSGLSVTAGNRQSLHELVIGEEGVQYNRTVQSLTESIAGLQKTLRQAEQALPVSILGSYTIDAFCGLALPEDLKEQLSEAKKTVSVLREAERVRSTEGFEAFTLPPLESERIESILQASLPELEASALKAVTEHFSTLDNSHAETWVSEGMDLTAERDSCPFCGQNLSGSTLLAHYRAYFSEAYAKHKAQIADAKNSLLEKMEGDRLAEFQRRVQTVKNRHNFWSRFLQLPAFEIASEDLARRWATTRDSLEEALDQKAAAPLESQSLGPVATEAINSYRDLAESVHSTTGALLAQSESIALAKTQASQGSLPAAEAKMAILEAIERRFQDSVDKNCSTYLQVKNAKEKIEAEKVRARTELNAHRAKVFSTYEQSINEFLGTFSADFRIAALAPTDPKGVPSSSYELVVNQGRVRLSPAKNPAPTFRTALSAGDRTTLALAFFFATLQGRSALNNTIVVLDDPSSSLDDGRGFTTVQAIRDLVGRAKQVVVLSHSPRLLGQLWERADKDHTSTMRIRDEGQDASKFEHWDAATAALTEYDRQHELLRGYAHKSTGDPQKVAPALRVVLEAFLRVAFAEHFPPGKLLKDFFIVANQRKKDRSPIISDNALAELDKLREYANQFHHNTSKTWQENLSTLSEIQLKGFAKRVIEFTRAGY